MKRLVPAFLATCLLALALAAPASAAFDVRDFEVTLTEGNGEAATQAGSHPFAMNTSFGLGFEEDEEGRPFSDGRIRDFVLNLVPGLVGDPTAYPPCSSLDFLQNGDCPVETQIGITAVALNAGWTASSVFVLSPPPGVLLRIGWNVNKTANIVLDVGVDPDQPHNGFAATRDTPQVLDVFGSKTQIWGDPANEDHDGLRGSCLVETAPESVPFDDPDAFEFESTGKSCPVQPNPRPFLTLPTHCGESLPTSFEALSWEGDSDAGAATPHAFNGCEKLNFGPTLETRPTSRAAGSPTGLDLSLNVEDEGLTSLDGFAHSHIRRVLVTLPEGMTANPSLAEGLEVCSEADLERETLRSAPGEGCPEASKIGTIEVDSPLVPETVRGSLFQAEPFANLAGDSLIAFYVVLKNPKLGIIVKQPTRVEPDPRTGQLVGIAEELPQLPFSSFRLKFKEGARSPLITPSLCGAYEAKATFTPWSGTAPVSSTSSFRVISGPDEGPCPAGGTPPFEPGFDAGSESNAAGRFSPFSMRLTRRDGDQDLTRFDATLPPGVLARIAGVGKCPEAQIALAKAKTGRAELASPSCPLSSRIGHVVSGAGVGSQLLYVPGTLYLAGPFAGAPLSVVGIVPAVAGPFDIGTVVVRQALVVDPVSGVVTADGARSDPIPHILAGIPLRVREIQVHVDRSGFTLNPTNCDPMATKASIWGGGADPFSLLDDAPVARSARYQAADCARLGFRPRLALRLSGGTRRGAHPALRTVFRPRPGDANNERVVVRFPRSAFVDQAHIRTICTRVQFAAELCPPGSIYGRVTAFTPLLEEPLHGPVYLRSSNNKLPDLVFDLHGVVDFEAVARIDSVRGALRAIAHGIPDAPISRVVIEMQGGRKGLIVNSRNLCRGKNRAEVRFDAHSGKRATLRPAVRPQCKKKRRGARRS